jgi:hypothetical protein
MCRCVTHSGRKWVVGLGLWLAAFSAQADYRATVLADVPVVYLRLGEVSGPSAVSEINPSYNGTYVNSGNITFGAAGALSNDLNTAVRLNINAYISIPGSAAFVTNTNPFAVEAWVRPRSSGMVNILTYRDSSNRDYQFYLNGGSNMNIWSGSANQNIVNNSVTYSTDGSVYLRSMPASRSSMPSRCWTGGEPGSSSSSMLR